MRATNERTARQIQNGGGWINPPTFIYLMMIFFFFSLLFILFSSSSCSLCPLVVWNIFLCYLNA